MAGLISVEVRVDTDVLRAIADAALKAPGLMNTVYKRRVRSLRSRMLAELRIVPPPPNYPIKWKTARQRRAFFASNGFGRGIPTQRTGALLDAYDVVLSSTNAGGILQVINSAPHARFVIGDDAQPFHIDHWPQIADAVVKYEQIAFTELVNDWYLVVDPFAGVPRT
jgi:hypothetical protein